MAAVNNQVINQAARAAMTPLPAPPSLQEAEDQLQQLPAPPRGGEQSGGGGGGGGGGRGGTIRRLILLGNKRGALEIHNSSSNSNVTCSTLSYYIISSR